MAEFILASASAKQVWSTNYISDYMRQSRFAPLRFFGTAFVEFFRNTPLLVQILWFYFALPILLPLSISPLAAAALGISLNSAAFGQIQASGDPRIMQFALKYVF